MSFKEAELEGSQVKIPRRSSWLLFLFGFIFLGWSFLDEMRHIRDIMTFVSVFIGLLAFAAGYCIQNIERRLALLEKHLYAFREDPGLQETTKRSG